MREFIYDFLVVLAALWAGELLRRRWKKANREPIKVGDVVRLKSGGPKMVVVYDNGCTGAECKWFDGPMVKNGWFCPKTIEHA